jgi:hypothetical protein
MPGVTSFKTDQKIEAMLQCQYGLTAAGVR